MAAFRKFIGFLLLCPVEQRLLIAPHQAVIVEQIGKLVGWMPIVQNDGGVAVYLHRVKQVAVLLFGVGGEICSYQVALYQILWVIPAVFITRLYVTKN